MNILTTTGLVQRYVGDWAREAIGPEFVVRSARCGSARRRTPTTR